VHGREGVVGKTEGKEGRVIMVRPREATCMIGYLAIKRNETKELMPWMSGTWIPDDEFDSLCAHVHRAEVVEYVYGLMNAFIKEIPSGDMLRSLVTDGLRVDLSPAFAILERSGFVLSREINLAKDGYMPREIDLNQRSDYITLFSKDDGVHFTFSKTSGGREVKFIVAFAPKRKVPEIHVEWKFNDDKKYVMYVQKDDDVDQMMKLARAAARLVSGRSVRRVGVLHCQLYVPTIDRDAWYNHGLVEIIPEAAPGTGEVQRAENR